MKVTEKDGKIEIAEQIHFADEDKPYRNQIIDLLEKQISSPGIFGPIRNGIFGTFHSSGNPNGDVSTSNVAFVVNKSKRVSVDILDINCQILDTLDGKLLKTLVNDIKINTILRIHWKGDYDFEGNTNPEFVDVIMIPDNGFNIPQVITSGHHIFI